MLWDYLTVGKLGSGRPVVFRCRDDRERHFGGGKMVERRVGRLRDGRWLWALDTLEEDLIQFPTFILCGSQQPCSSSSRNPVPLSGPCTPSPPHAYNSCKRKKTKNDYRKINIYGIFSSLIRAIWMILMLYKFLLFIYFAFIVGGHVPWCACGDQGTTLCSQFSPGDWGKVVTLGIKCLNPCVS